ncbi:MAG: lipoprotein-releasing ABC transporter permease subunit [Neomegalonema sp.]
MSNRDDWSGSGNRPQRPGGDPFDPGEPDDTSARLEKLRDDLQRGLTEPHAADAPQRDGGDKRVTLPAGRTSTRIKVDASRTKRPGDPGSKLEAPGDASLVRSMLRHLESRKLKEDQAPPAPATASGAQPSLRDPNPQQQQAPNPPAPTRVVHRRPPEPPRPTRPFSRLERMLAGRYLRARRKEGFISVIAGFSLVGIALGVATLIIVMSVMNGFRAELVSKIVGANSHLTILPAAPDFDDYEEVSSRVRAVPGVTRAAPLVEGQALAAGPRGSVGVIVRGLSQSDLLTVENVAVTPEESLGSLTAYGQTDGIAIGSRLARKLGVTVGDSVTLLSPRGASTPFGVAPRKKDYEVLYIFKVGMAQYDEAVMFMPLDEAQAYFNKPGTVDAVEVMVATPNELEGYREDIEAAVGRPMLIGDWQQANRSFLGALKTERTVMFLILTLIILVAALNIISGLIMLVKDKGADIAILRTMGLSRGAVMRVFFMCGASIGFVGTLAGVVLGVVFCLNIDVIQDWASYLANGDVFPENVYILSKLPAKLHTEDVIMTVSIALGLSFLAPLYPAWRAARLDPVAA